MPFDVGFGERLNAAIDKPLEYNREIATAIQELQKNQPASRSHYEKRIRDITKQSWCDNKE